MHGSELLKFVKTKKASIASQEDQGPLGDWNSIMWWNHSSFLVSDCTLNLVVSLITLGVKKSEKVWLSKVVQFEAQPKVLMLGLSFSFFQTKQYPRNGGSTAPHLYNIYNALDALFQSAHLYGENWLMKSMLKKKALKYYLKRVQCIGFRNVDRKRVPGSPG